jgi:hypothetical protein
MNANKLEAVLSTVIAIACLAGELEGWLVCVVRDYKILTKQESKKEVCLYVHYKCIVPIMSCA